MLIRAYICVETKNNEYYGIYLHQNGQLSYAGAILLDYYPKRKEVESLISAGDLDTLEIKSCNNKAESRTLVDLDAINNPKSWIDYCYIYRLDDNWFYFNCGKSHKIKLEKLKDGLEKYYQELGFTRTTGCYGIHTADDIAYYQRQEILKNNWSRLFKKSK